MPTILDCHEHGESHRTALAMHVSQVSFPQHAISTCHLDARCTDPALKAIWPTASVACFCNLSLATESIRPVSPGGAACMYHAALRFFLTDHQLVCRPRCYSTQPGSDRGNASDLGAPTYPVCLLRWRILIRTAQLHSRPRRANGLEDPARLHSDLHIMLHSIHVSGLMLELQGYHPPQGGIVHA
ncbi:hypothetical protein PYCCODRAFT_731123 [Trametes coccinea BRFM310]|uniref:Uncharacterized protein n=1 Tax=Trametes coccinea (strain BRFM310) TaxID=1353009 RepID=A0A1Y2IFV1_TRAC3|nr:hypothetical protein PYCCODRAFT_731123 [Trametes coccinea BRFM310]